MRKYISHKALDLKGDAAERLRERMVQLRVQIAQKRAAALREGKILETPKLKRRRWEERAAQVLSNQEISDKVETALTSNEQNKDDLLLRLGDEFLRSAEQGYIRKIQAFINEGFPVTYQDPISGETALHIAAACKARGVLRVLLMSDELDFLLRDKQGRLASEMAYLYGHDPAVARLLGIKERNQAIRHGQKLRRRT